MPDVELSLCDMKELYSLILEECSSSTPTIMVIKNMIGIFEGLTHQFFILKQGDNRVMLVFEESDLKTMKSNLRTYLKEFNTLDISTLEVIDCPVLPLSHSRDMYKHAVSISRHLDIICPQMFARSKSDLGFDSAQRMTIYDENDVKDAPIGDIIFVLNRGRSHQIHSIAHELRHCWQAYKSKEGFYKNYIPHTEDNTLDFMNQKEEIDAEAYASLYVEKYLGVSDGTALMYETIEDAEDFKDYTSTIREYMKNLNT